MALGEEKAASLVAIACDRVGIDCVALTVKELGLVGRGPVEDAWPVRLDSRLLEGALVAHDVVVVPGFAAVNETGGVVLLGRGGSDLTAVFIAAELGLDQVRLIKDVDGVYEGDPAQGGAALRYDRLSWDRARAVAGKLVQPRAIDVAEARGVSIAVSALGRERASVIAPQDRPPSLALEHRRRRVAVAGCGVVGGGVLQRLLDHPEVFEVVGVLVRDPAKARDVDVPAHLFTADPGDLLRRGPDLLVEALSEGEAGERLIRAALKAGLDVVSANKQALAADLAGLRRLAQQRGARLLYSAAVGGGAPVIETVRAARASGEVLAVEAVLNGTVNFVIDKLAGGASFDDALAQARAAGFAEEDPSSDLEGRDAAAKLRILAFEAFGAALDDDMPRAVLDPNTPRSPEAWSAVKQVARCRRVRGGLPQRGDAGGDGRTPRPSATCAGSATPYRFSPRTAGSSPAAGGAPAAGPPRKASSPTSCPCSAPTSEFDPRWPSSRPYRLKTRAGSWRSTPRASSSGSPRSPRAWRTPTTGSRPASAPGS